MLRIFSISVSFQPGANPRKSIPISCVLPWRQNSRSWGPGGSSQPPSHFPGPAGLPPALLRTEARLQVSPGSPVSPSLHPVFVTVLSKAATPLSGAPDHPAGKKKDNWGICCLKQKRTNLVCFSSNTYISQFWLIHSSKSKSSSLYIPS